MPKQNEEEYKAIQAAIDAKDLENLINTLSTVTSTPDYQQLAKAIEMAAELGDEQLEKLFQVPVVFQSKSAINSAWVDFTQKNVGLNRDHFYHFHRAAEQGRLATINVYLKIILDYQAPEGLKALQLAKANGHQDVCIALLGMPNVFADAAKVGYNPINGYESEVSTFVNQFFANFAEKNSQYEKPLRFSTTLAFA